MKSTYKLACYFVFIAAVLGMAALPSFAGQQADYVFKNGAVYTIDSKNPTAQAIAITGKHISYVGTTTA